MAEKWQEDLARMRDPAQIAADGRAIVARRRQAREQQENDYKAKHRKK